MFWTGGDWKSVRRTVRPAPRRTPISEPTPALGGPPVAVLGTENFYADLLAEIGGTRVQATSLLNDPNADPHEFETSPQDAAAVADSRLVIVNGLGYDDFMQQLLAQHRIRSRVVINVQQLLGLPDDVNVHVWYDPQTMPKVAAAVESALSQLEPTNAPYFSARYQAYLASLAPISAEIASLNAQYAGTPIAFTENVAGYLTDQIGLIVKSPAGFMKSVEEGTDPAPRMSLPSVTCSPLIASGCCSTTSQVVSPTTQNIHDLAQQSGAPIVGVVETHSPSLPESRVMANRPADQLGQALGQQ